MENNYYDGTQADLKSGRAKIFIGAQLLFGSKIFILHIHGCIMINLMRKGEEVRIVTHHLEGFFLQTQLKK